MWMKEPGKIADEFYMLGTSSNPIYLLKEGTDWILIEGGLEIHVPVVLAQLKNILPDLSLLKYWFITHSHYDHCGAVERLQNEIPGIKLYASNETIANFCNSKYVRKVHQLNRVFKNRQLPADQEMIGTSLDALTFVSVSDDEFKTDHYESWQFIKTPGHSTCSISFYNTSRKILFVSDAFGEIITAEKWFPLAFESMTSFIESIRMLDRLEIDYLALGHYGVLSGKEAKHAASNALKSCYDMIRIANDVVQKQGMPYVYESINEEFGVNERSFIPFDVYTKSIAQLIHVLKTENYIH